MFSLVVRQTLGSEPNTVPDGTQSDDDNYVPFWWTRTGQIVRWAILIGILVVVFTFLFIGNCHARRRLSRGLPPLRYHRWMLSRNQRARYDPNYAPPAPYYNPYQREGYNMNAMPPPIYDPSHPMPPVYQPPTGGTKVAPSQFTTSRPVGETDPSPSYEAPPGPPPGAAAQANPADNPFRG